MESKKQKGRLFARGEDTLEKYSDRSKQVGSPTHYIHKSIFANMERRNLYSHINFNPHLAAPIPSLKFSKPPPSSSPILAKDTLRQNIQDSNIFTQILNSSKDQLNKKLDDMQIYETKITCQKTFLEKQRKMRPKGASLSMELKNQLIAPLFDRKPESSLFVGNSSKEDDLLINNRKSDGFRPGQKHSIKERDTSGNVLGEGKANHNKNNIGQIASTTLQAHSTQLSSVSPKARPSTFNIINKSNFSKPKNSPKIELISRELNNPPKKLGQGKYLGIRTRELRCGCLGKEMNKEERETSAERMSEKKIDQESPEEKSLSPKRGILHHYPAGYLSASQSPKYICHSQRISQINEGGGEMVINTTPNTPILHGKQASPQQSPKTTPNKVARAGRWATVRSFSMGNDSYLKLQNKYRNRIQINTIINKCSEISRTSKQHNNLSFNKKIKEIDSDSDLVKDVVTNLVHMNQTVGGKNMSFGRLIEEKQVEVDFERRYSGNNKLVGELKRENEICSLFVNRLGRKSVWQPDKLKISKAMLNQFFSGVQMPPELLNKSRKPNPKKSSPKFKQPPQ